MVNFECSIHVCISREDFLVLFPSDVLGIDTIYLTSFRVNWEIGVIPSDTASAMNLHNESLSDATSNHVTEVFEDVQSDRINYVYIYSALIVIVLYLVIQRALALHMFCVKASRRIHERMLQGLIRAKMYFFSTNASGRIINRFSKDLYEVEYYLALILYDLTLVSDLLKYEILSHA